MGPKTAYALAPQLALTNVVVTGRQLRLEPARRGRSRLPLRAPTPIPSRRRRRRRSCRSSVHSCEDDAHSS